MKWWLGALLVLLLGAAFHLGLLVYAMYVLLGVMLMGRFLTESWVRRVRVERVSDRDEAEIGDIVSVEVRIANRGFFTIPWLLVEEALPTEALAEVPPHLRCHGSRVGLLRLRAGERHTLTYGIECLHRGYYQIGPLLLESGDVFGLHRRFRVEGEPVFVTVRPKLVPLEGYDLASRRPVGEVRLVHRLFQDPTRIAGVRPYETGDPLNRIHWRATARTGRLQCKTYEPSVVAGATLLLDFHTASFSGSGAVACRELAVTASASIANAVHQMSQPIGLVSNGRDAAERIKAEGWNRAFRTRRVAQAQTGMQAGSDRLRPVIVETRRSPDQLDRLLQTLARLEPTDGLRFAPLVLETASRLPRNTTIVAVLSQVTEEDAVVLASLHRRGWSITVVLIVFEASTPPAWAEAPDWAAWLEAARVDLRRVSDETSLARFCAAQVLR